MTVANVVAPPPDASPPVVTLLSPNGGIVSGQVNVTASATDNVGVARVDLLINGGVVGYRGFNAPWSFRVELALGQQRCARRSGRRG